MAKKFLTDVGLAALIKKFRDEMTSRISTLANDVADNTVAVAEKASLTDAIMHNKRIGAVRLLKDVATYNNTDASVVTGIIKITLPVSWSNTMMRLTIKGIDYSRSVVWELQLVGYNYTGPGWYSTAAILSSSILTPAFKAVQFAHDGSKCCILLGESTTEWSYPAIAITDVQLGATGIDAFGVDGWKIELIPDRTGINMALAVSVPLAVKAIGGTPNFYKFSDTLLVGTAEGVFGKSSMNEVFIQARPYRSIGFTPGMVIAYMPMGFRPPLPFIWPISMLVGGTLQSQTASLEIGTDGVVKVYNVLPETDLLYLDIRYYTFE